MSDDPRSAPAPEPGPALPAPVLLLVVALAGGATMVVELGAVRLLAPWYGASSSVWTNVIGVVLAALALGYTLGARFASGPSPLGTLSRVLLTGAVLAATLPALAPNVAAAFMPEGVPLASAASLLVWGSLAASIVLFLPVAATLGCACPLAVEALQRQRGDAAGHAGGHVLASSTLGSLCGTFGTTHLFVPNLGIAWTFTLAAAVLGACGVLVRVAAGPRGAAPAAAGLLLIGAATGLTALADGSGRNGASAGERVLARGESSYQSLLVTESGEGDDRLRKLKVNESLDSFQSVWTPSVGLLPAGYYYNHFALPYGWATREAGAPPEQWKVMIVGLGAGTAVRVLEGVMDPGTTLSVTGVELDGAVLALAEAHFDLQRDAPDRRLVGGLDGRPALALDPGRYDQVIVDAYANNMEVPPHLASVEAFELMRERLVEGGWLTVNIGGFGPEDPVVQGIGRAAATAFGAEVFVARVPFSRNLSLHARRGASVPQPGTLAFGSRGRPLPGDLGRLLPPLQLEGAWAAVSANAGLAALTDDRSGTEGLQARSIRLAEERLRGLDRSGAEEVRVARSELSASDSDVVDAAMALLREAGDVAGAAQAADTVEDPRVRARLGAYLRWSAGDPFGALQVAEGAARAHGADVELLSILVDLALVVGANRLASARLADLERAILVEGLETPATALPRLREATLAAEATGRRAAGALFRARVTIVVAALALLLAGLRWRPRSTASGAPAA